MEIYRFRVYKGWYAYTTLEDAETARQYFLDSGHSVAAVGDIEKSQDNQGFEFKMNATEEKRAWGIIR